MSSPVRSVAFLLTCLGLASVAPAACAVEPLDTFSIRIGGYVSKFDTEIRADGETSRGTTLDLKRDLGLGEDDTIGFVGLTWRPWDHHEFGLSYYRNGSDSTRTLQRDIEFDGTVYEASATVQTHFDIDAYEAYYVWWAASHENWALGPRVGLVWYSIELGIDLRVAANGEQAGGTLDREVSTDLPAPTIGGSWRWAPSAQWRITAEAGYFTTNINDIDADVTFGRAGVEWYPWERVGFSLDYVLNHVDASADKSSFSGNFDFTDSGLRLGVVYRF